MFACCIVGDLGVVVGAEEEARDGGARARARFATVPECVEHLRAMGASGIDIRVAPPPDGRRARGPPAAARPSAAPRTGPADPSPALEAARRMRAGGVFVDRSTPAARFADMEEARLARAREQAARAQGFAAAGGAAAGAAAEGDVAPPAGPPRPDVELVISMARGEFPCFGFEIVRCGRREAAGRLVVPPDLRTADMRRAPSRMGAAAVLTAVGGLAEAARATAVRVPDLATYTAIVKSAPRWLAGAGGRAAGAEVVVGAHREVARLRLDVRPPRQNVSERVDAN